MRPGKFVLLVAGGELFGYLQAFVLKTAGFRVLRASSEAEIAAHLHGPDANDITVVVSDFRGKPILDNVSKVVCFCELSLVLLNAQGDIFDPLPYTRVALAADNVAMLEYVRAFTSIKRGPGLSAHRCGSKRFADAA